MRKTLLAAALLMASSHALAADRNAPATMSNFSYDYFEARIGASPVTLVLASANLFTRMRTLLLVSTLSLIATLILLQVLAFTHR